jgi:hypothetical protein
MAILVPIQSDIENPQVRRLGNPLAIPVKRENALYPYSLHSASR